MYQSWVCFNIVLGLGIAQYVEKSGSAQQCIKIGYISTMCWDWLLLSRVLVFENCLAMS